MAKLAKNQETARLNFKLNQEVKDRLEELRDEVKADSVTEVIRRALALYDHVITKHNQGYEILLRDKKGEVTVVEFF